MNLLKKLSFAAFVVLASLELSQAQNPKNAYNKATMSLEAYKMNTALRDELKSAKENIDIAAAPNAAETNVNSKTWRYRGSIYTAIAMDKTLAAEFPDAALVSYDSWVKALEIEEAKAVEKGKPTSKIAAKGEFKEGFEMAGNALFNGGIEMVNGKGYEKAYPFFAAIVNMPKRAASVFGEKAPEFKFKEIDAQRMCAVGAMKLGKVEEGEGILRPMIDKNQVPAEMLPAIYNILADGFISAKQNDKARQVLAEARKKYPAEQSLLFTEINLALAEGRLSELETQLKQAVAAQPNNVELVFVMGNMYDGLFRDKVQVSDMKSVISAADEKTGLDYFKKSEEWYNNALKINNKHYNGLYSLGVLYVNYSNYCRKRIEQINNAKDLASKAFEQSSDEYINKAMNMLLEAEKVEPNNAMALDALKRIYGMKGDSAKYSEYSEKVQKAK